ncbi:hypothetical protein [Psychroserpens luteolus]|uniref:hypothetical protein n=1 Tax=Psychroserpens luteolus TaxID=2855840 RepID=UPI001E5CEEA7|nr:hypothetical protein [Psychroserpens luteolus]MCD2260796.1 hypothetical protein [Psychroserpens luteolus]
MNKHIYILLIICCLLSCTSVKVLNESQNTTIQNVSLGTIGLDKDFVIEKDYNNIAIPKYEKPIKIYASLIDFNKASFKAFENALKVQSSKINLTYNDTLDAKPKYLKLEVSDRLEVINSLQSTANKSLFELLKNNNEAHLVTSIAIAIDQSQLHLLANAEEIFLEGSGIKSYSINSYSDGKLQHKLKFNTGVVFAYQTSSCCWKQNDKYQLEIVDLVENNDKCPNNTYRSSKRAEKKINYYKF